MIDKEKLIQSLHDACDKDVFKELPKWIIDLINNQPEVDFENTDEFIELNNRVISLDAYIDLLRETSSYYMNECRRLENRIIEIMEGMYND